MSNPIPNIPRSLVMEQRGAGREHVPNSHQVVHKDGKAYHQDSFSSHPNGPANIGARVVNGALAIFGGPLNISEEYRGFGETALYGEVKRDVLYGEHDPLDVERNTQPLNPNSQQTVVETQRYINGMQQVGVQNPPPFNRLIQRLGYDPLNRKSIQAYLERPEIRAQLIESNGNYMFPETRRDGTSSFLFVPKGDFTKATSIVLSDAKTGELLKGKDFHRAMHTYSTQYDDMIKGMAEQLDNLATQLGTERGMDANTIQQNMDALREEIKRERRVVVLDHQRKNTRVYGHVDANKRAVYLNPFRGSRIDWSKPTSKDVDDIHKAAPENKLSTNRPFANQQNNNQQQQFNNFQQHPFNNNFQQQNFPNQMPPNTGNYFGQFQTGNNDIYDQSFNNQEFGDFQTGNNEAFADFEN